MLSYLIVILSLEKLENRLHKNKKTDIHKDKQLNTKTKNNLKKPTLSVVIASPPITEYLYYALNVEGLTQKDSLLPAYIK